MNDQYCTPRAIKYKDDILKQSKYLNAAKKQKIELQYPNIKKVARKICFYHEENNKENINRCQVKLKQIR